ncbi:hypothetical protein METP3_01927 [Methanosarcinales archaeon]|nr:hypothetical protein METP3_01927 [Methanosarcinales archaeon]
MVEKYPNLVWALNSNEELKLILFETCKDKPRYLFYLDDLIYPLIKSNCKSIQEKIKDANIVNHTNFARIKLGNILTINLLVTI